MNIKIYYAVLLLIFMAFTPKACAEDGRGFGVVLFNSEESNSAREYASNSETPNYALMDMAKTEEDEDANFRGDRTIDLSDKPEYHVFEN